MTKLISPFPNVSVYADKTGKVIARHKPGPNPKIKTHPQYENTRRNMATFGNSAKASKLIRYLFHEPLRSINDYYASAFLTGRMYSMFRGSIPGRPTSPFQIGHERPSLNGFNFNSRAGIYDCYFGRWSLSVENDNKRFHICIPPVIPTQSIRNPNGGGSHYRIVPYVATIDFDTTEYNLVKTEPSDPTPRDNNSSKEISLCVDVDRPGNWLVLVALGIEFFCGPDNQLCLVAGGTHNALTITNTFNVCVN